MATSSTMASAGREACATQRGDTVLGQLGRVPLEAQGAVESLADSRIVVDDKHAHRHQCGPAT